MSTLKVNNIESFTSSDPVTISDVNGLVISSNVTASGDISSSGQVIANQYYFKSPTLGGGGSNTRYLAATTAGIPFFNSDLQVMGAITASGLVSASRFVGGNATVSSISASANISASFVEANRFNFQGGSNVYLAQQVDNVPFFNSGLRVLGSITASNVVSASKFVGDELELINNTTLVSYDLATDTPSANGSKVTINAITAATINDGAFATFNLHNPSIALDSVVYGSFNGTHSNTNLSGSILTARVIGTSTASVFIHNETGGSIPADTPFTASFVVL